MFSTHAAEPRSSTAHAAGLPTAALPTLLGGSGGFTQLFALSSWCPRALRPYVSVRERVSAPESATEWPQSQASSVMGSSYKATYQQYAPTFPPVPISDGPVRAPPSEGFNTRPTRVHVRHVLASATAYEGAHVH